MVSISTIAVITDSRRVSARRSSVVGCSVTFEKPVDVHGERGTVDWIATGKGHT